MAKKLFLVMLILVLTLTGCSSGILQEDYDALLAENERLKQQLAQHERNTGNQENNTPYLDQNTDIPEPAAESDFIYVNNGSEVQINGYKGNGGQVVIPTEIEGSVVTRIAPEAFEEAENVTGIVLPEKLQYIGDNAFYDLKNMTGVLVIPETVTTIEGHAFQSTRLTGLVIKSSCEININAFANIYSLEFIYVEEGCAPQIGTSAFSYAEALTVAVFPSTMIEIKDETFKACNSMVIYTTPSSFAEDYANRNFISVNTKDYATQVKNFSNIYGTSSTNSENTSSDTTKDVLSQH